MDKIKVLMAADYPVGGEQIDGGVQAVSAYIVDGLKRDPTIELSIVSFRSGINELAEIKEDGVTIFLVPRAPRGNITFYKRDFERFMHCVNKVKPDLIHAQGAAVEGYLAVKSGYPSVVTFHGIIGEDAKYKSSFKEWLRFKLISWIAEDYCVKRGRYSILISPYVQRYYGARLRGEYRNIANPIKDDFYKVARKETPGRILYAGKIIKRKGIVDLIEALNLLDRSVSFKLVLAGALDDQEYLEQIKSKIKNYNLEDRVEFLGLLNEGQVLEEFSKASILVLPSYQETAPMVIQQAMAAHVPVVATSICGVPDQLQHGEAGLMFDPGDARTCASHLHTLLTDSKKRQHLSNVARLKAESEFHVSSVVAATVRFYREIIGRHA